MKQKQVNLNDLFQQSMVEIPFHTQQQIENIPKIYKVWDWALILQVAFITPFALWVIVQLSHIIPKFLTFTYQFELFTHGEESLSFALPNSIFLICILGLIAILYPALKKEYVLR